MQSVQERSQLKSIKLRKQTTKGRLRILYNGCKQRHKKKHEGELITLERFKAIYQAQGGVCVETGVPFDLQSKDLMPSPDRIDNDAGYVDGNIRFVTWRINKCVADYRSRDSKLHAWKWPTRTQVYLS